MSTEARVSLRTPQPTPWAAKGKTSFSFVFYFTALYSRIQISIAGPGFEPMKLRGKTTKEGIFCVLPPNRRRFPPNNMSSLFVKNGSSYLLFLCFPLWYYHAGQYRSTWLDEETFYRVRGAAAAVTSMAKTNVVASHNNGPEARMKPQKQKSNDAVSSGKLYRRRGCVYCAKDLHLLEICPFFNRGDPFFDGR